MNQTYSNAITQSESHVAEPEPNGGDIKEETPPHSQTVAHLEWILQSVVDGVNNRTFDFSENCFMSRHIAPNFAGELERLPGQSQAGLVGIKEHMDMQRLIASMFPKYRIRIFDFSTCIDEDVGKAVVFFRGETTGLGDVVLPSMCTAALWRFDDGLWKMVSFRGVRGMVDGCEFA